MARFFNKIVTPLVKASAQASPFTKDDIVFDWHAFDIPRGGAKLIGVSTVVRANDLRDIGCFPGYLFAKDDGVSGPRSLGTPNSMISTGNLSHHLVLGNVNTTSVQLNGSDVATNVTAPSAINIGKAANVFYNSTSAETGIVFDSEPRSGADIGLDRYYIAGISQKDNLLLRTAVALDDDVDISANNGTINTLDGDAPNTVFQQGDLIHAVDDIILGEIDTLDADSITFRFDGGTSNNQAVLNGTATYTIPADLAAWRIQNGAGAAGDLSNNEFLFNVHPLTITLHFEN